MLANALSNKKKVERMEKKMQKEDRRGGREEGV